MTATETDLPKWARADRAKKARAAYQPPPEPGWLLQAGLERPPQGEVNRGPYSPCGAYEARLAVAAAVKAARAEVASPRDCG